RSAMARRLDHGFLQDLVTQAPLLFLAHVAEEIGDQAPEGEGDPAGIPARVDPLYQGVELPTLALVLLEELPGALGAPELLGGEDGEQRALLEAQMRGEAPVQVARRLGQRTEGDLL